MPDEEEMEITDDSKDDLKDLTNVPYDELLDTDDLVEVNTEEDILDANEDGELTDLTEVTDEDVMGDVYGKSPLEGYGAQKKKKVEQQRVRIVRTTPPVGMSGIGY